MGLFIVGFVFLLERIATVGLNESFLSDVRDVFRERHYSLIEQIGSNLSVVVTTMIILRGAYDSHHGFSARWLLLTMASGAPLSLANGARGFLLSYTLCYVASFMLCRANFSRNKLLFEMHEFGKISGIIVAAIFVFSVLGFVRGGYGGSFNIAYTVLIWPVSTLGAMDIWVLAAINSSSTQGLISLGWLATFAAKFGILSLGPLEHAFKGSEGYFALVGVSAMSIPRSILPDLIFDFGLKSVAISMGLMAFVLEYCATAFAGKNIFFHVIAAQCLLASFATIQNSVITPGFGVSIFWGWAFYYIARSKVRAR